MVVQQGGRYVYILETVLIVEALYIGGAAGEVKIEIMAVVAIDHGIELGCVDQAS